MSLPNIGCINNSKIKNLKFDHLGDNKDIYLCVQQADNNKYKYSAWKRSPKCSKECPDGMKNITKNGECYCIQQPTKNCNINCVKSKY